MQRLIRAPWLCATWLAVGLLWGVPTIAAEHPAFKALSKAAPTLNAQALRHALAAMRCATNNGSPTANRLAVIDYSRPSTERRLWIFDLRSNRLLLRDFVAHGRESGDNLATRFSNKDGSFQSSLGLFVTAESYIGQHGYSLRLDGLERGVNDNARERDIVIHGADYVDPEIVEQLGGRLGRSLGCPAVRPEVAQMVVDNLKEGQFIFSWYPDPKWLHSSAYLNCKPKAKTKPAATRIATASAQRARRG